MCSQFNTQQLNVYRRCLFKRDFTVQREVNSRFLPLMGLRLIKQHFTFSCSSFYSLKGFTLFPRVFFFPLLTIHLTKLHSWVGTGSCCGSAPSLGILSTSTSGSSHTENTQPDKLHVFRIHSFLKDKLCLGKAAFFSLKTGNSQTQKGMEFALEMNQLLKFKTLFKIFEFCLIFFPHIDHFSSLASKTCARACFFGTGPCVMGTACTGKAHTEGIIWSRKSHEIRKPSNVGGGSKYPQTCHLDFFTSSTDSSFTGDCPFPHLVNLNLFIQARPEPRATPRVHLHTRDLGVEINKTVLKFCLWCMGHSILFQHLSSQVWDLQSPETTTHSPSPLSHGRWHPTPPESNFCADSGNRLGVDQRRASSPQPLHKAGSLRSRRMGDQVLDSSH